MALRSNEVALFTPKEGNKMNATTLEKPDFKTWKTIKFVAAPFYDLKDVCRNVHKDENAKHALRQFNDFYSTDFMADPGEKELELVLIKSAAELGLNYDGPNGLSILEIFRRAGKLGLQLCPPELAVQLCAQYIDQPKGECVVTAMLPFINLNGGEEAMFSVEHGDKSSRLCTVDSWIEGIGFRDYHSYVFLRR